MSLAKPFFGAPSGDDCFKNTSKHKRFHIFWRIVFQTHCKTPENTRHSRDGSFKNTVKHQRTPENTRDLRSGLRVPLLELPKLIFY